MVGTLRGEHTAELAEEHRGPRARPAGCQPGLPHDPPGVFGPDNKPDLDRPGRLVVGEGRFGANRVGRQPRVWATDDQGDLRRTGTDQERRVLIQDVPDISNGSHASRCDPIGQRQNHQLTGARVGQIRLRQFAVGQVGEH